MGFWDYLVNSAASTSSGAGYSAGVAASAYNHELQNSDIMVADSGTGGNIANDSEQAQIEKLASELGIKLNDASKDYLVQYMLNDKLSQNAFNRELESRKTAYQDTVKDLQAAGVNPFLAFQGLSGAVNNSAGGVSGGNYVNRTAQKNL